jgi:SAM-dependent methyltransferase
VTLLSCRHCGSSLHHDVIDLGHQPPSNAYLRAEQRGQPEITYPLKVYVCTSCWLMQLPAHAPAETLFSADYAYVSSVSTSWCAHAERYVDATVERLGLDAGSMVVELASNDGYLLRHVLRRGIPCLGIEPTRSTAQLAIEQGVPTLERFFSLALAEELVGRDGPVAGGADLVVANNVIAHVPDINDVFAGIARLLKPTGQVSIECPHLLQLLAGNQFDTIYHEHYSYLSLQVVERIARQRSGRYLGRVEQVLVEGANPKDASQMMGRTRSNRLTFFPSQDSNGRPIAAGELVDLVIEDVRPFSLSGSPLA